MTEYVELQVTTNFSFLRGASHPASRRWSPRAASLRALLSRGADAVSVVSNAPFALQEELEALRVAQGCRIKHT